MAYDPLLRMTVVTSSPSRAWVHSDCSVYMALPSACRLRTWRSGQATAAPVATGMPWPMAPPVRLSQSWGGAPAVAPGTKIPAVFPSSLTIAPSGSRAPTAAATVSASSAPVGRPGRAGVRPPGRLGGAPRASANASRAAGTSSAAPASTCTSHPSGTSTPGSPG